MKSFGSGKLGSCRFNPLDNKSSCSVMNFKREIYRNIDKDSEYINSKLWQMLVMIFVIINYNMIERQGENNEIHIHDMHENFDYWYLRHEY